MRHIVLLDTGDFDPTVIEFSSQRAAKEWMHGTNGYIEKHADDLGLVGVSNWLFLNGPYEVTPRVEANLLIDVLIAEASGVEREEA